MLVFYINYANTVLIAYSSTRSLIGVEDARPDMQTSPCYRQRQPPKGHLIDAIGLLIFVVYCCNLVRMLWKIHSGEWLHCFVRGAVSFKMLVVLLRRANSGWINQSSSTGTIELCISSPGGMFVNEMPCKTLWCIIAVRFAQVVQ